MEGADAEEAFARAPPKTNNRNNKKSMKLSSKVAPLVAALNEQAAQKLGLSHLSEQEQLLRKNKKKANQLTRKQKQKQKKRDDKQAKQNATKHGGQDLDDD